MSQQRLPRSRSPLFLFPFAFMFLLVPFLAGPAEAAERHVAQPPLGSDANPGTEVAPWATLQHAADSVGPGDTVVVHGGDYQGMYVTTSGSAVSPIVFRAAEGELVRVTGDNPVTPDGINIEAADHIVVEGFRVDGRGRAGIRAVLCEHVIIRDNSLDANDRWGIFTGFCDDLVIEDNETSNSVIEHGIYVSNSGDRPTIRGNRIWGNAANGIHMNGDVSQGGDGVISDALVENNVIFGNGESGGSGINCDGVQSSLIRNNLVYDTHASGISLYRIDGGGASTGNRVLNNTVIVAADGRWGINIRDSSTGNTVKNNIVWSRHGYRGAMSVCPTCHDGFVSDHNLVEDRFTDDDGDSVLTLDQWRASTGQDAGSVAVGDVDGLFEDSSSGDFRLVQGAAVDAGESFTDVPTDLEGVPRPLASGWDAGAYEGVGVLFFDGFEGGDATAWTAFSR